VKEKGSAIIGRRIKSERKRSTNCACCLNLANQLAIVITLFVSDDDDNHPSD
jgi:hypothetical protein